MKLKLPSLKHRRPLVYISLGIYSFLSAFIIFESCLPDGLSGIQSRLFATVSAWFVNNVKGDQVNKTVNPVTISNFSDTSYLGRENDISNIGIGTTSLATIQVIYPEKISNKEVYDTTYSINYEDNYDTQYTTSISSSLNKNYFNLYLRVTGKSVSDNVHTIGINFAGHVHYDYSFKIVDLPAPQEFLAKVDKTDIKMGESLPINTQLKDEEKNQVDYYLKRYFDLKKIERSSSDENVAIIDEFGVIHGRNAGNSIIKYGNYTFDITVKNESIIAPVNNEISLSIDEESNSYPYLLDYDYVFSYNSEESKYTINGSNDYSTLVYADFINQDLEDQSISWDVSDNQKVRLAPYKYDESGYPIYHDDNGRNCIRVCGYREKGDVTLTAISNNNPNIKKDITLTVDEALPTSMEVNLNASIEMNVNDQKTVTANFEPKNVNNKKIHLESDSDILEITNNDSQSVTIKAIKKGTAQITVTSLANESLKYQFDVKSVAKKAINNDNYDDFHLFMRKAAGHFSLFLITGVFGSIFFYSYLTDDKKIRLSILFSMSLGLLTAGLSEFIQLFVPGRSGIFTDIMIDFTGYVIGTMLVIGVIYLVKYIKTKKTHKNEEIE